MDAGQAGDLVHDFLLTQWPSVKDRYDPQRGSLEGYTAKAFAQFARSRLVREARWQRLLSEESDASLGVLTDPDIAIDIARVRQALDALTLDDQRVLLARFGDEDASERTIARSFGWSRYELRSRVTNALARLAVGLGEPASIGPHDFAVARLLFGDGFTIAATAASLGITEAQVRAARARTLLALARGLGR